MAIVTRNRTDLAMTPTEQVDANAFSQSAPRRNLLLIIWQQRWIILGCVIFCLAVAILYISLATPIYQATAKVYVQQNGPRITSTDPTGAALSNSQNFLWTQCELIRSRAILEAVADEPGVRQLPSFSEGQDVPGALRAMIAASVGRRDDIISISVNSAQAQDTAVIANAAVIAFTKYHDSAKRSLARQILEILQSNKIKIDQDMERKRLELLEFKKKNASFTFGGGAGAGSSPSLERMSRLSGALTEAQLATFSAISSYNTAKAMMSDKDKVRQLLESRQFKTDTAQSRYELRELQQRLAGLSKSYLPGFPELTSIQESIRNLQDEMVRDDQKLVEAYVAELEAQVLSCRDYENEIAKMLEEQRAEVLKYNTASAQYADLAADLEQLKSDSLAIYDRVKQLSVAEEAGALNVNPVESAQVPLIPIIPNKALILAEGLLLGALFGIGLAFVRDLADQRIRSAAEIEQLLALPVLGVVPHIESGKTPSERGMSLSREPMSDVSEAYRTVRTAVYFGQPGGLAKTLLITSPAPGDGKTTLASNLAIAMAQAGNRILLLDADFRKPSQHKIFEIEKRSGLSTVLAGDSTLREVIYPTSIAGLDLLPCGPIPANPSEILNSQTFADLLEELSATYDHVLLDSPPVMPVTDARILAASCDATLLAVRAETTTRKAARFARDTLASVGSEILGVVINDVPRRRDVYGYYYTDADVYKYGYGAGRARGRGAGRGGVSVSSARTTDEADRPAAAASVETNGHSNGNGKAHAKLLEASIEARPDEQTQSERTADPSSPNAC